MILADAPKKMIERKGKVIFFWLMKTSGDKCCAIQEKIILFCQSIFYRKHNQTSRISNAHFFNQPCANAFH